MKPDFYYTDPIIVYALECGEDNLSAIKDFVGNEFSVLFNEDSGKEYYEFQFANGINDYEHSIHLYAGVGDFIVKTANENGDFDEYWKIVKREHFQKKYHSLVTSYHNWQLVTSYHNWQKVINK